MLIKINNIPDFIYNANSAQIKNKLTSFAQFY